MLIFVDEHAQPVVTAAITTGDGVVLAPRFAAALKEGGIVELPAQSHPGFLLIGENLKMYLEIAIEDSPSVTAPSEIFDGAAAVDDSNQIDSSGIAVSHEEVTRWRKCHCQDRSQNSIVIRFVFAIFGAVQRLTSDDFNFHVSC